MAETTEPAGEALDFLQRRVRWFGLLAGALVLAFYVYRVLDEPSLAALADPSMLTHAGAGLSLLGMWLALRGPTRPARWVRLIEISGLVLASTLLVVMGMYIPLTAQPGRIVVMALAVVHMARAIYVPSSARRTALFSVIAGVVIVGFVFRGHRQVDLGAFARLVPELAAMTPTQFAATMALDAGAWWVLFGSLAVAASQVIFGLRKQVGNIRALGQYHLEAEIGAGGMGVVFRAHHALLRRETAVKLLPPDRAGEATLQRFEREVKLTARLRHPNTVTVYDYGRTPEGVFYYAMELLDGATLEQIVDVSGPFPVGRAVHVLRQAAGALAEAHGLGLIHRDIKPANIMLCNQGGLMDVAKVLDFGLVKELESGSQTLTRDNAITGTPLYMSPEAISGAVPVDPRSDLYALGAVAYYLLVGEHVFRGESLIEVCSKHLLELPEPPSARLGRPLPVALERLVLDCLEKKPEQRPQSARELLERLALASSEPWGEKQAESWWREHGPSLKKRPGAPDGVGRTIQVDLGLRRAS
ncbi:MAG TPA: serine/threonine-protein kinase [Polyangiaceae bacterium]|nr:serine/threonine-protein kinase [Polyangiaceae bacterium]